MKKINNNIFNGLFLLAVLVTVAVSCTKKDKQEFNQLRMFMPGDIKTTTEETQAILEWDPSLFTQGKAVKYTVEVSPDSTFQTISKAVVVDTSKAIITDAVLTVRQKYFARVKANAYENIPESKWVRSASFKISGEQAFFPLTVSDIIDNAVLLKWKTTPGLVKITVTPEAAAPYDVTLTTTDLANEKKLISGLTPNTSYEVEIFNGTKSKGYLTFRTKATLSSGTIIDLRGISGRPSVLFDTLSVIPSGSTVILERGQTYTVASSLSLSKSVTIMSGDDLLNPNLANIYFTNNFNFATGSVIDSIVFKSVRMYSDNYTSRYVFNTTNGATVGKIGFENCRAEIFRGLIRLQSGTTIVTNVVFENSIMDSLANYGLITVDNASCKAENILINNSTIYKTEKVITSKQNSTSVIVSNSTVSESPLGGGANYFIDYSTSGTNNVTNGITISNCIFGLGKSNSGNVSVKGIRANAATAITVSKNYKTADYVSAGNDIPSLVASSKTALQLWEDPAAGNFKIIDNSFPGKSDSGDPRWRRP